MRATRVTRGETSCPDKKDIIIKNNNSKNNNTDVQQGLTGVRRVIPQKYVRSGTYII